MTSISDSGPVLDPQRFVLIFHNKAIFEKENKKFEIFISSEFFSSIFCSWKSLDTDPDLDLDWPNDGND